MNLDSLMKLYVHELKDLYSAENQTKEALPRFVESAQDEDLKNAFAEHLEETKEHIKRIESIFENLDFEPGGHKCKGAEGLIEEAKGVLGQGFDESVQDAALIAAAQRLEHYEMAGYGVARTYAEKLGRSEDADLLQKTLEDEGAADRRLTRLAERRLNFEAMAV